MAQITITSNNDPLGLPNTGTGTDQGMTWQTAVTNINANFSELYAAAGSGGALTPATITASASTLPINGLAAAQGGSVTLTGGASSTSGNAGGAVAQVGGTPGATGIGGAASITGAVGGATSGAGGAATVTGGAGTAGSATGGVGSVAGGAGSAGATTVAGGVGGAASLTSGVGGAKTGTGAAAGGAAGTASLIGGVGGATASSGSDAGGAGGDINVTAGAGGAASAGTGNGGAGGTIIVQAGAGGTSAGGAAGADGVIIERSVKLVKQGAPTAATTSALLTAANVLTGIITVNQGAAGASAQQLPAASAMDTALPDAAAGDAFDFSVINISTNAAEPASLTTNTGLTLVGDMDIIANSASTTKSAGRFRARKTGTGAWTVYRLC